MLNIDELMIIRVLHSTHLLVSMDAAPKMGPPKPLLTLSFSPVARSTFKTSPLEVVA